MTGSRILYKNRGLRIIVLAAWILFLFGSQSSAREKEVIAVLDLRPVGASKIEASALTDRLQEEILRTGRFILVDRSQMEAVLNEQALQQTGCTEQECAVQVGQILGVRKIVAGKVTKIGEDVWQISALIVDVETAETERLESIQHQGDFFTLLTLQIPPLAAKLAGESPKRPPAIPIADPSSAQMSIVSNTPGATVSVDGDKVGLTPLEMQLPPGEYTVEVTKEGHFPVEKQIRFEGGGRNSLNASLSPHPPEWADYEAEYSGWAVKSWSVITAALFMGLYSLESSDGEEQEIGTLAMLSLGIWALFIESDEPTPPKVAPSRLELSLEVDRPRDSVSVALGWKW